MRRLSLVASLFLASCASKYSGEYPVQGICRSCQPHKIRGEYYTPQLYYDYDEEAIASWYGPGFHGKPKATGERFDQHKISAAHKTLPLPTVVKVTNTENGKSINLVVDDRGPYVDDRIIDLSVGAAKAIGVYQKGIAKVRVQSIPSQSHALSMRLKHIGNRSGVVPGRTWEHVYKKDIAPHYDAKPFTRGDMRSKAYTVGKHTIKAVPIATAYAKTAQKTFSNRQKRRVTPPVFSETVSVDAQKNLDHLVAHHSAPSKRPTPLHMRPPAPKQYFVQVASFVQESNAHALVKEVGGKGHAFVDKVVVPPGQVFYKVKCGPYPSKEAAKNALTSLDILGHNPRLVDA